MQYEVTNTHMRLIDQSDQHMKATPNLQNNAQYQDNCNVCIYDFPTSNPIKPFALNEFQRICCYKHLLHFQIWRNIVYMYCQT